MTVYLIRHGETDYNVARRFQGMYGASRLTEKGKEQARRLSPYLAHLTLDRVLCSTAHRAKETLSLALPTVREDDVTFLDELREVDVGSLTDRLVTEAKDEYPDFFSSRDYLDLNYARFGGESNQDIQARAARMLKAIEDTGAENVAVVCHGAFIWFMIATALNIPVLQKKVPLSNCSVSAITLENGRGKLAFLNMTAESLSCFITP